MWNGVKQVYNQTGITTQSPAGEKARGKDRTMWHHRASSVISGFLFLIDGRWHCLSEG